MASRLEQIKARSKGLTPEPWRLFSVDDGSELQDAGYAFSIVSSTGEAVAEVLDRCVGELNAQFLANAREDLPWCVAWIDQAKALIEQMLETNKAGIPFGANGGRLKAQANALLKEVN